MAGWQYRLTDFDPDGGETEEEWAAQLAAEGWRMWRPGAGPWVSINGRRVRRWSLRRWVDRPHATAGNEGRVWDPPPDVDEWGRVKPTAASGSDEV